jgi:hypothetical protein
MHINDLRNSVLYNLGDSGGILTYKGSPVDSGGVAEELHGER